MLNDTDLWPVPCPYCGKIAQKEIGWLNQAVNITCDHCGGKAQFYKDEFAKSLENIRKNIDVCARSGGFAKKMV